MRMNEVFFPELERLVSWFYTEYGKPFKRKDGTYRYEVTRHEFIKAFKMMDDIDNNGEAFIRFIEDNHRYAPDGLLMRVANDYFYNSNKRKKLKEFKNTLLNYKDLAIELLDNDYRISLVDLVKMLNLKKDYVADIYKSHLDYIDLPSQIRHLLDPKGGDDFYRRQIFININSVESFIEENYRIARDNISVNIAGSAVDILTNMLTKRKRINNIAKEIIEANEIFYVPEKRKKLSKKEIKEIMGVLDLPEELQDKTKAPRFNFRDIGVHENVSILERKEDLKIEHEINRERKVTNGKYALAAPKQANDQLIYTSHYELPLEFYINDVRRYVLNIARHPDRNRYFKAQIGEGDILSNFTLEEDFNPINNSSLTVLLPAEKVSEEIISELIRLMIEKASTK